MKSTILFVSLALLATALAVPSDSAVAEEEFAQDASLELLQTNARAYAEDMLEKSGSNACEALATDTQDEVKKNVEAAQALMDKLNNGAECEHTGKKEVEKAELELTSAKGALTEAQAAYDKAAEATINFGDFKLSQLSEGSCSIFFNSKVYTDAKAKRTAAKTALDKAKGAKTLAEQDLVKAKVEQQEKAEACACEVKDMHAAKLVEMNKDVEAANIKAWTESYHLKCVLDGTKASDCKVPPVPKVKAAKLSSFADAAKCAAEGRLEDKCDGWVVDGSGCGNGKVGFQIFSGKGDYQYFHKARPEMYQCPKGWHWAKDAEYFDYMGSRNCKDNNGNTVQQMKSYTGQNGGQVYYLFNDKKHKNCGWNGYNTNVGRQHTYYLIPKDFGESSTGKAQSGCSTKKVSLTTNQACYGRYQHMGNYLGYQGNTNTNVNAGGSNSYFAGIICMKD